MTSSPTFRCWVEGAVHAILVNLSMLFAFLLSLGPSPSNVHSTDSERTSHAHAPLVPSSWSAPTLETAAIIRRHPVPVQHLPLAGLLNQILEGNLVARKRFPSACWVRQRRLHFHSLLETEVVQQSQQVLLMGEKGRYAGGCGTQVT